MSIQQSKELISCGNWSHVDAENDIEEIQLQMKDHIPMDTQLIDVVPLDEKFSNQTTTKLDSYSRRLTLWCIIYMIMTTYLIANSAMNYISYNMFPVSTELSKKMIGYYSLQIFANTALWCASISLLTCLYGVFCKENRSFTWSLKISTTFLFVVGGLLQFGCMINGIDVLCPDTKSGYCVVEYIGLSIYVVVFSFYMGFDICTSIGDKVRVRILVKSSIIFIRSFLFFLKWYNLLQEHIKTKTSKQEQTDQVIADTDTDGMSEYWYLQATLSYFALFLCCLLSILYLIFIFVSKGQIINSLSKIIGFGLILSTGNVMISETFHSYAIAAVLTLIFDLQCVE